MTSLMVYCLLFGINVNCDQWDRFHRQPDDGLPPISWRDCGLSTRNSDPTPNPVVSTRVQGGDFAQTGEFPWFAYIGVYQGNQLVSECGASILNEWFLLTAAHCAHFSFDIQAIQVIIGTADKSPQVIKSGVGRVMYVQYIVLHPKWQIYRAEELKNASELQNMKEKLIEWEITDRPLNREFADLYYEYMKRYNKTHYWTSRNFFYDIALLKLSERIVPVFNDTHYTVNSICLPKTNIINNVAEGLMVLGMGSTKPQGYTPTNVLKKGMVYLAEPSDVNCNESPDHVNETQPRLCLLNTKNPENLTDYPLYDSFLCAGDSGSPAHQYYHWKAIQIGIASRAYIPTDYACGLLTAYIRVSLFVPWIRYHISKTSRDNTLEVVIESKTNHLLIVTVITAAIISLIILLTLFWIMVTILISRPRKP